MAEAPRCVQGHKAFIYDRGGMRRVDELTDLSMVRWERTRDGVSEATIRLEGESCARQRQVLNTISTHRHELVLFRGRDRVWEGPLHRIANNATNAEVVAKDVLAYANATPLTQVWDSTTAGTASTIMSERLHEMFLYEMANSHDQFVLASPENDAAVAELVAEYGYVAVPTMTPAPGWIVTVKGWEELDPPANVLPYLTVPHWPNEAGTSAKTLPFEMGLGQALASAGRTSGIDFTTIGRAIYIWDVSRSLGRLRTLTEADFYSKLILTEYGADHAQSAYVVGQEGAFGSALNPQNLGYYGPWTTIYTAYNEEGTIAPTQAELDSQSRRNLNGRSPAPIEVRVPDNSGIVLSEDLTINMLVCGVQVPLLAVVNGRQVSQMQKLDHVTVIETGEQETVQVTLTPATKPDDDEEEEP